VFPLSIIAMAVRTVNYGLFVFCLTPQFVLIAELFQSGGAGDPELAGLRALDSLIGGALGLVAGFVLWPSWEAAHVPGHLAEAIRANRDYLSSALAAVIGLEQGNTGHGDLEAVRRRAGLASNNAEASLQRLMGEPHYRADPSIEPSMVILGCVRRLAGVAATLSLLPDQQLDEPARLTLMTMRDWLDGALTAIADAVEGGLPAPELPPAPVLEGSPGVGPGVLPPILLYEMARIERQIEVMRGATDRLNRGTG
jgi:uncharacterized membrane protein YccC